MPRHWESVGGVIQGVINWGGGGGSPSHGTVLVCKAVVAFQACLRVYVYMLVLILAVNGRYKQHIAQGPGGETLTEDPA